MTIIEGVRQWIKQYDGLSGGRLNVDFLPEDAQTYSVDVVPCQEIVKRYMDGTTVRQFLFVLSSREFYGADIGQNRDNLEFYESFSEWIDLQNRLKYLPDIGDGRQSRRVEVTSTAYPFVVDAQGTARYQIQLRLNYVQKGDR